MRGSRGAERHPPKTGKSAAGGARSKRPRKGFGSGEATFWSSDEEDASAASSTGRPPNAHDNLDEAVLAGMWDVVRKARADWEASEKVEPKYFKTVLRAGITAMRSIGEPMDAVRGYASGAFVQTWCKSYGLADNKTYSLKKYGPELTHLLALYWTEVMEHYHVIWRVTMVDDFAFDENDHRHRPKGERVRQLVRDAGRPDIDDALAGIDAIRPHAPKRE